MDAAAAAEIDALEQLLERAQRYDSEAKAATDESKGQALRVTITYVLGLGGGSWTGPKVLAVKAEG